MTSEPDKKELQYMYCPISHNVKAARLWNMIKRNIFFENHAENEIGRLVPDLFLFFRKAS